MAYNVYNLFNAHLNNQAKLEHHKVCKLLFIQLLIINKQTYIKDWSIAVSTSWSIQLVIIFLTKWLAFPLKEISWAKWQFACNTCEMLRMPCFTKSRTNLAYDWFITCGTRALLHSAYTLPSHVRLKAAEHRVQLASSHRLPSWRVILMLYWLLQLKIKVWYFRSCVVSQQKFFVEKSINMALKLTLWWRFNGACCSLRFGIIIIVFERLSRSDSLDIHLEVRQGCH